MCGQMMVTTTTITATCIYINKMFKLIKQFEKNFFLLNVISVIVVVAIVVVVVAKKFFFFPIIFIINFSITLFSCQEVVLNVIMLLL